MKSVDALMRRAVSENIFPGGQLLVSHAGRVLLDESIRSCKYIYQADSRKGYNLRSGILNQAAGNHTCGHEAGA